MNRRVLVAIVVTTLVCSTTLIFVSGTSAYDYHLEFVHQQPDPLGTPLGSVFTYQGLLQKANVAVNDTCDFQFSLWDSLNDPAGQIGTTQGRVLAVTIGLFVATDLDFGADAFTGDARWLQIGVRCPSGSGSYTVLTPRQALTAAPYALYSRNADLVDNQHASAFANANHTHLGTDIVSAVPTATLALSATHAPWSGLAGVPAGFADGVDNVFAYVRTVIVGPVGTASENGSALLSALASITDASATHPYLLKIEPGLYDLVTDTLRMMPFVDIEGSGELVTTITAAGSMVTSTGTVQGADNTELRFLTVESDTGPWPGSSYGIGIYNDAASPRLLHVTAVVTGNSLGCGVCNHSSSPIMDNVRVAVSGSGDTYGVYNRSASPTMTNVTIETHNSSGSNYGVYNESSSPTMDLVSISGMGGTNFGTTGVANDASSPTLRNVDISCSSIYCTGVWNRSSSPTMNNISMKLNAARNAIGVLNYLSAPTINEAVISVRGNHPSYGVNNASSSPTLINSSISCALSPVCYGMYNDSSSAVIQNSTLRSLSELYANYGIRNVAVSGTFTVTVDNSRIIGSNNTIWNDAGFTTRIGASQLDGGGVITNTGMVICAGVYDENYVFYASTCP